MMLIIKAVPQCTGLSLETHGERVVGSNPVRLKESESFSCLCAPSNSSIILHSRCFLNDTYWST